MTDKTTGHRLNTNPCLLQSSLLLRLRSHSRPPAVAAAATSSVSVSASDAMDATTATITPPPPSARHCGPKAKRQRNAASAAQPLGDVTSLLIPTTPTNPTTTRPCSPPKSPPAPRLPRSLPSPSILPPPLVRRLNRPSPPCIQGAKPPTRQGPKKIPFRAGTASYPPPATLARTNRKTSVAQVTQSISSSAPCHRSKKEKSTRMENTSSGKPKLPEDFVKKQRAYFEEIDAFELPEEDSETDLE